MEGFEVVFYRKPSGRAPMDEFLESLPPKLNAKVHRDLGSLREEAHRLREPQSKRMGNGLFELRSRQGDDIARSFYFFFSGRRIVVTNGFVKKTQKTPRRELSRALAYKADWEERFGNG
ncbi:type II toxin-antitoxin system RelE/ParE family toxin [Arabiibacter massiliensis]|uniref:type II toxin-antitoxin system RelE/ParE family toxin n=1 Tax=Arabiibacter massiliensis TaxID=1870985 RepID=UPI0009B9C24B|nr:type II toxin-antitoxin system RelE/ParE family toxin [Arabiibacter massiliensis]